MEMHVSAYVYVMSSFPRNTHYEGWVEEEGLSTWASKFLKVYV